MSESSNSLAREPTRTTLRSTDTTTPETTPDPSEIAETLLKAFYAQDEREAHLRAGDADAARRVADAARDLMGEAFVAEFPHVPEPAAHLGGVRFVEALFVQDEIENREAFADAVAEYGLDADLFLTDVEVPEGPVLADPRWDLVEAYLRDVCDHVDVDYDYASAQTRFWKLHGQTMDWMDAAATAHRIKLDAMLDGFDVSAPEIARLADYFVAGVAGHDEWGDDEVEAVDGIVGLVTRYYEELFALRGN
ncbi:hypothetical protein [Salinigranum sp. GCM10025319]|uniref:hypothetical protein n=1 Tax=Salinigranum sp. GCM10025319 TaxID=3252687 RepID=UPI0036197B0B